METDKLYSKLEQRIPLDISFTQKFAIKLTL